jgi:hypothetical protein
LFGLPALPVGLHLVKTPLVLAENTRASVALLAHLTLLRRARVAVVGLAHCVGDDAAGPVRHRPVLAGSGALDLVPINRAKCIRLCASTCRNA